MICRIYKRVLYALIPLGAIFCLEGSIQAGPVDFSHPSQDDIKNLSECVSSYNKTRIERTSCINRVVNSCEVGAIEAIGDVPGETQCLTREFRVWDFILNGQYKKILSTLDEAEKQHFVKSELAWISFVKTFCQWPEKFSRYVAQPIIESSRCNNIQTAEQAIDFVEIYQHLSEH